MFAWRLAKTILQKAHLSKGAFVIGLEGNLGSGKTTFAQGFARGLGIKEKIQSPTFVILKRFKVQNPKFKNFYHVDAYRLQNPKEFLALGWEKIISKAHNIMLVEWADRITKILPKDSPHISFVTGGGNHRIIRSMIQYGYAREKSAPRH